MGEPKWTQGEWRVFMGYLTSPDGQEYPTADVICDGRVIATVHWPLNDPQEFFANARVLAAAPDLYQRLSELVEYMRKVLTNNLGYGESEADEDLERFIRALRKARGEDNE